MAWRRKIEEFEADLYKVPLPRFFRVEKGELERKRFEDGEEKLEITFRGVDVPDGARVAVVIDATSVCEVEVRSRRGRVELSSRDGREVPAVRNGSIAEIRYHGRALLRGTFRPD